MTSSENREARLLALLQKRFTQPHPLAYVLRGIGDDAAVLSPCTHSLVLSVDAQVQDVHFRHGYLDWHTLGRRAYMVSASDLAAMGAKPHVALAALTLPLSIDDTMFDELCSGMADAATDIGAPIIGGNLSTGSLLSLTMTVMGTVEGHAIQRDGAKPGHRIYVTGTLGAAALGLYCLEHGITTSQATPFIKRWRFPQARIQEGLSLCASASSAIDLSDGLYIDLKRVCQSSGVGAKIDSAKLPLSKGHHELSQHLGLDSTSMAVHGGEDYELLYTSADQEGIPAEVGTCIGEIMPAAHGIQFLDAEGHPLKLAPATYSGW